MRLSILSILFLVLLFPAQGQEPNPVHALSFLDAPKYGADWQYPDYVNPDAPKGGTIRYAAIGTAFDTFNPFTIKGSPAAGSASIYETLTLSPEDDILSEYGLIAESMILAPDKTWMVFNLRPEAKWQDGKAITAEDVVFSFHLLKEKGAPQYRLYYADVIDATALSEHQVRFTFKDGTNRELPIIMGQLPVLPKHYWETRDFEEPSLDIPLGSGPYKIARFEAGRSVMLERVKNYWGANLPLRKGQNNFDTIRYDYYRDTTVALEAFKAGAYDLKSETSAKSWATAYDIPQVKEGRIKLETIPDNTPSGMQAFIFNLRKPYFQDRTTRLALNYAFDFEWENKTLFYGQYTRTRSFFDNSELAATGLPDSEERAILEPFRGHIPEEVFTKSFQPPITDGSGNNRDNLALASKLLDEAGWKVVKGRRMRDGQEFKFEILLVSPSFERVAQPLIQNLDRLGISASLRTVDSAQYQNRVQNFDYDMIVDGFGQSLSPGNEQRNYWSSSAADQPGSNNTIGIKDKAIDALVEGLISAPNRHRLVVYCRALDRVLQWNYFVIPNWHLAATRLAYWNKFGRPPATPKYGVGINSWWIDPAKEAAIRQHTADQDAQHPPETNAASQSETTPLPVVADRGRSPLPYIFGALALFFLAFWLGKRFGRK